MQNLKEFKVNNFDLLRFLAATEVIIDHYFQHLNIPITKRGLEILYLFPGVPVFFVISGYLISASYERNTRFSDYIKNRILRIFPGLWGCIFLTIILISLTGVSFFRKETLLWLPGQLLGFIYTPHFLFNYGFGSYNGSLWTIPIELQFYLFLPFFYFILPRKKLDYWLYGLFALFLLLHLLYLIVKFPNGPMHKLVAYSFIPYFYLFLLGVIFQRLRIYRLSFIYNKAHFWVLGYVLYCLLLPDLMNPIMFPLIKNLLLGFCVISLAYTLPGTAKKILRNNDISYGIYIYHGLLLTVIVREKLQGTINIFTLIGITYILAYLSWILIEKPFIKSKKRTIKTIA
jgi:peptidoglycan/LPS O-acetylase OafA/YrhL